MMEMITLYIAGLVGPPGEENVDWTGCREYPDGRACHDDNDDDDDADDDDDWIPLESYQ